MERATYSAILTTMQEESHLKQIPLFTSLTAEHLADLATKLGTRNYKAGETIFHKDDPGSVLYVIKGGQVKIATASAEGDEVILAILTDGDFFGELSLLDESPRSASAIAMAPTQAMVLQRKDFVDFLTRYPEIVGDILAALSRRLRGTDSLVEDVIFLDLPARLAKRLLQLANTHGIKTQEGLEINLKLTQQDIADLVGATRVAVNKQLRLYQKMGVINLSRNRIIITRPEDLQRRVY